MDSRVSVYLRLLRLTGVNDFFLHYVIITIVLAATFSSITLSEVDGKFPLLIAFSISSALFSCVVNDLCDVELDRLDPETKNPLARGEISEGAMTSIAIVFLAISALLLVPLPLGSAPMGITSLILGFTYSYGIRARLRPFLDIMYHGVQCAFPFIMTYTLYRPFDETCFFISIVICVGGAVSELMRGVKAHDFDKAFGKNTVVMLGSRRGLALCLGLMVVWLLLVAIASFRLFFFPLTLYGFRLPIQFLVLPPLSIFILKPVIQGIIDENYQKDTRVRFRKRALLVLIVLASSSVAVFTYSSKRYCYGDPDGGDHVIRLGVRTIIAGYESWSVAFIKFRYSDDANHYYLLLHRDGVLELTKVVASEKTFLTFVKTDLSPFEWHDFEIVLEGSSILVFVDGVHYLNIIDDSLSEGVVCLTGICSARLAFFKEVKVDSM